MDILALEKFLKENDQPSFRLKQIKKAIFQDGVSDFSEITTIPNNLRELLKKTLGHPVSTSGFLSFQVEKVSVSADKRSAKALLKLRDGNFIETVLISPKPDIWSVCVSTQAGCPLNCGFCATGQGGFKRDLTAEEITDQVLFWKQWLKKENKARPAAAGLALGISNVVYMGMGEPFLNWAQVKKSLEDLISPDLFGFGSRSISVSTAGIPEGIETLARHFPQVNLAVSLHFATDEKRNKFMPINRKYDLETLRGSLTDYFRHANRKVFLEYIMLSGINDSLADAKNLVKYLKSIGKNQLLHVNLINYNSGSNALKSSDKKTVSLFKEYLLRSGINATIRKSLGADIEGACGQLAGKVVDNS